MSPARRQRILRVRAIEARVATQEKLRLQRDAEQIGAIVDRLLLLQQSTAPARGLACATELAGGGELAGRLALARRAATEPLAAARSRASQGQMQETAARQREEMAKRLYESARRERERTIELRLQGQRPNNARNLLGDET
jgi:hypothetical protein